MLISYDTPIVNSFNIQDLTDNSLNLSAEFSEYCGNNPVVTYAIYSKNNGILSGMAYALNAVRKYGFNNNNTPVSIRYMADGSPITENRDVAYITGHYNDIVQLETIFLGYLSRGSRLATNTRKIVSLLDSSHADVVYIGAKNEIVETQEFDGYAIASGGCRMFSTTALTYGAQDFGQVAKAPKIIPYSLISTYFGDIEELVFNYFDFVNHSDNEQCDIEDVVVSIDYNKDIFKDFIRIDSALLLKNIPLYGVCINFNDFVFDKSYARMMYENILAEDFNQEPMTNQDWRPSEHDEYFDRVYNNINLFKSLIFKIRSILDSSGYTETKIGISGNLNYEILSKILSNNKIIIPIDLVFIGSDILGHNNNPNSNILNAFDFYSEIIKVDGYKESAFGGGGAFPHIGYEYFNIEF